MLKASIDAFLALRRATGFQLKTEEYLLRRFAQWSSDRSETHVRAITATAWAATAPSPWERERRLQVVARFARHARAEDPRHEIPPIHVFGRSQARSRRYIYSREELQSLMNAAAGLAPSWPLRAEVFATLLGTLASTGLRISE